MFLSLMLLNSKNKFQLKRIFLNQISLSSLESLSTNMLEDGSERLNYDRFQVLVGYFL
jgi:hypothetical protein